MNPPDDQSRYPALESFIETATPEDINALLAPIRAGLAELKGPRKAHADKVQRGLDQVDKLLATLLTVRERLAGEP